MALVYNEETGQYEYEDPNALPGASEAPSYTNRQLSEMTSTERLEASRAQEEQARLQAEQALTDSRVGGPDTAYQLTKPKSLLATNEDGSFSFTESVADIAKSVVNPPLAFVTDFVDLGHAFGDAVGQTGNLLSGQGWDWNEIYNDADNPLTALRLQTIGSDTANSQLGDIINKTIRVGFGIWAGPKFLLTGIAKGIKAASLGGKLAVATKVKGKTLKAINAYDKFRKTRGNVFSEALAAQGSKKGASNVMKLAGADAWLYGTYADVVKASANAPELGVAANWMKATGRAAGQLTKRKAAVGTVAEALAWDMFMSFNVAGEQTGFDETIFDFFDDIGMPVPAFLTSDVLDSPLDSKMKGLADGLVTGTVVSALTDVFRIARFTRAFQNASPNDKAQLINAFNLNAQSLGKSVATVAEVTESAARRPATYRQSPYFVEPRPIQRSGGQLQLPPDSLVPNPTRTMADYTAMVESGKVQNQLINERYAAQARNLQPELAAEQRAMSTTGIVPYENNSQLVAPTRPPTPTVSPQGFKKAMQEELDRLMLRAELTPDQVRRIQGEVMALMPTKRVDIIDYMTGKVKSTPVGGRAVGGYSNISFNGHGVLDLATSIRTNVFLQQGLDEGWMSVGPDMLMMYNRKMAYDFDEGTMIFKEASAIDQADELARYKKQFEDVSDPATQEVQGALNPATRDAAEAARQYDDYSEMNVVKASEQEGADPALVEAKRQAAVSEVEQAQLKQAEEQEIIREAVEAYRADVGDEVYVSEMIGRDLTQVGQVDVVKVGNRQYQVINDLGESIDGRTYSTLKAARQASGRLSQRLKDDAVKLAKASYANAENQVIDVGFERIDAETGITAKPGFTAPQLRKLSEFGISGEDVAAMGQADMRGMRDSIAQLLETAKGTEKRVLNGIKAKLDVALAEIDPKVRLAVELDRTMQSANKMLKNGEICF